MLTNLEEIIDPDVGPTDFMNYPVAGFAENEWHRISVHMAIGSPWVATVTVDGVQSLQQNLADTTNGTIAFSIGAPYLTDTSSPWVIRISNVVVDVQ